MKPEEFALLVEEHIRALLAFALSHGIAPDMAEELVQETFYTFLDQAAARFEGRSRIRTYLIGILYNKMRGYWREEEQRRSVGDDEEIERLFAERFDRGGMWSSPPQGPEDLLLLREELDLFEECFAHIPFQQRTVFYLKEVEDLSTEEICKIMGITPTHLGVLLFRARNRLRECMEKKHLQKRGERSDRKSHEHKPLKGSQA